MCSYLYGFNIGLVIIRIELRILREGTDRKQQHGATNSTLNSTEKITKNYGTITGCRKVEDILTVSRRSQCYPSPS